MQSKARKSLKSLKIHRGIATSKSGWQATDLLLNGFRIFRRIFFVSLIRKAFAKIRGIDFASQTSIEDEDDLIAYVMYPS